MAKLSARGRKELARVTNTTTPATDSSTKSRRYTRTLMSDGTILEKIDVVFQDGSKHSYGWKVRGKAKEGLTGEDFLKSHIDRGWIAG